jgi:CRP-like cAMP-binding protein
VDVFSNLANICYFGAYMVRDIMVLRFLVIVGGLVWLPYGFLQPEPLWPEINWKYVFIGINVIWLRQLWLERRPVDLTVEQQRLYLLGFRMLTPREMLTLMGLAAWEDVSPGTRLAARGQRVERLALILSGKVRAERDGQTVGHIGDGDYCGGLSFLKDDGEPSPVDLVAEEPTRLLSWAAADIRRYAERKPELQVALKATVGGRLADVVERIVLDDRLRPES